MPQSDPRANPLARGPLETRADLQRAVRDLYEPLLPYVSTCGARVRLGSFGAVFEAAVAELEGFARPLYGIVPLTVGGGDFDHWDRLAAGLEAGTDPGSDEYWGPVAGDADQRMVEQAAIGLALAFCPEQAWEPLTPTAQRNLVTWLNGVFEHEPAKNNWQFFRVLVALGLERVGVPFDRGAVAASLERIERYRLGDHWYADGKRGPVDYYVPFAFHTYGLFYAAANDLGLGDDARAQDFRQRAAGFASDFQHWFAPDGAAVPMGRSLTYRFALASFWGALAWANVDSGLSWGTVRGLSLRHLRWWAGRPISDRDGVLSVGFAYDNRRLSESYNSPASPYWCLKAFAPLAAPADHPFWTADEEELSPLDSPVTLSDAGWVVARDAHQAVALVARRAPDLELPEQAAAKYRKFAYSSVFGFSGDFADALGVVHTDSMLALSDADASDRMSGVAELSEQIASLLVRTGAGGHRRVRLGSARAGVEDGLAWSTWWPWPDVRIDTVCVAVDGAWHLRFHRTRNERPLHAIESGFAVGFTPVRGEPDPASAEVRPGVAVFRTNLGCSAIVEWEAAREGRREGSVRALPPNANLMHPHVAVPLLSRSLPAGDHRLACAVFASPVDDLPDEWPAVPSRATALLDRISEMSSSEL
jgi:hypothetical protein